MEPNTNRAAALEAFRRRAGQQPSSAGIAGGAPAANQITPSNPLAPSAMANMGGGGGQPAPSGQPSPSGQPAPGGTTTGTAKEVNPLTSMAIAGIKQLSESSPQDTELFLMAMIKRLRGLTSKSIGA